MNVKNRNRITNNEKQILSTSGFYGVEEMLEVDELGTETEAEIQMKLLLKKQLKTDMTLKDHLAQHREFKKSNTYTSMTELIQGPCTLKKYREIEKTEEKKVELQQSGLTDEEIKFYMMHILTDESKTFSKSDPSVLCTKLQEVKNKIESYQEKLNDTSNACSGAKVLSRHAMDIERTLYVGCERKKQLDCLIKPKMNSDLGSNDPFKYVKEASERLLRNVRKQRKRKANVSGKSEEASTVKDLADTNELQTDKFVYEPHIHHVIVPFEESEIAEKRLDLNEIRKIPRFENYEPGIPNKVLYLKNLHPKVTLRDLQALFGSFSTSGDECIEYKLLSGGMRGQAFVTFQDTETAEKALESVNGFMLKDRPVIIAYGKKKS